MTGEAGARRRPARACATILTATTLALLAVPGTATAGSERPWQEPDRRSPAAARADDRPPEHTPAGDRPPAHAHEDDRPPAHARSEDRPPPHAADPVAPPPHAGSGGAEPGVAGGPGTNEQGRPAPGRSGDAPGRIGDAPGRSGDAPGRARDADVPDDDGPLDTGRPLPDRTQAAAGAPILTFPVTVTPSDPVLGATTVLAFVPPPAADGGAEPEATEPPTDDQGRDGDVAAPPRPPRVDPGLEAEELARRVVLPVAVLVAGLAYLLLQGRIDRRGHVLTAPEIDGAEHDDEVFDL